MTDQHTPERWEYDPDDHEIRDWHDGSVLFDGHNATNEQAVVAAAAPLMLEALRDLVDWMPLPRDTAHPGRAALDKAHAAIAAATGEDA